MATFEEHTPDVMLHQGVAPLQSLSPKQATHLASDSRQNGTPVRDAQSVFDTQPPQLPLAKSHAGGVIAGSGVVVPTVPAEPVFPPVPPAPLVELPAHVPPLLLVTM